MTYSLDCAIWETTLKCNLRCSHCGSSAGNARSDELDTEECLSLCEQLAELNCDNVAIMGGLLVRHRQMYKRSWDEIKPCLEWTGS